MKKILLGLVMLLTTATMNAQIELEHVFEEGRVDNTEALSVHLLGLENVFIVKAAGGDEIYIYNSDYTLYKKIKREFGMHFHSISKNIFTTDNKICFINYEADTENITSKLTIINEDNQIVKEISCVGFIDYAWSIRKINNQYKLCISTNEAYRGEDGWLQDGPRKTYIYSCPGNGETTTSVENVPAKVKRNAFPNPATDLVTLPYDANGATSMKIYDMQGKLVERKFLDKNKQELQLNVKDYPTGMYFFEVNGESNSFIVE